MESVQRMRGAQAQVPNAAGTWKDLTDRRQFDGLKSDRPGTQRRPGDHRDGQRRLAKKITVNVQGKPEHSLEFANSSRS
jgi:hypothetical protein